jgi:hypothetical protein
MPHHSGFPRHPDDFYIEDDWCFDALPAILGAAELAKGIYDPACGVGTIPMAAIRSGFPAVGSDKIDRPKAGPFNSGVRDFLEPRTQAGWAPSIVMNPPNGKAQAFIEKALIETRAGGVVAALVPISFLVSQERYGFFQRPEVERIVFLSKRPSMPDGDALLAGAVKRGGGKVDYAWAVFRAGGRRRADVTSHWWMPPVVEPALRATPRRPQKLASQLDLFGGAAGVDPEVVERTLPCSTTT